MSEEQVKTEEQAPEKPAQIEEQAPKKPATAKVSKKPEAGTPKKSRAGLIFGIINLLLLLALAGGGYYLLDQTEEKLLSQGVEINKDDMREIESSKQFNTFQSQLTTMQEQVSTLNQEMTGKDNHFTKTLENFSDLHLDKQDTSEKRFMAEINHVKLQLGKTRGDWLMADAEYLLSIANQRLHLVGDVHTAKMALEAADQRLRESGDSSAFKVRGKIAEELAKLHNVNLPDIVGIYSSLQILKKKGFGLAVLLPYSAKPLTGSTEIHNHQQGQEADHGMLDSFVKSLEGYVTVKHSDHPTAKILSEQEVEFIKQQLNVKLEMIKIGLVQQNDAVYHTSIADTKQWVNENFTQNKSTSNFVKELDKLEKIQLRNQLPDVSQSLKMLRDITKFRLKMDPSTSQIQRNSAIANTPSVSAPSEQKVSDTTQDKKTPIVETPPTSVAP